MSILPQSWLVWIDTNLSRGSNLEILKQTLKKRFPKINANQIIADRIFRVPNLTKVLFPVKNFQIYFIKNFLTSAECRTVIELAGPHFETSSLFSASTYADPNFRSSSTCHPRNLPQNPFWDTINTKICNAVNISDSFSEPFQIQRYKKGNQFKLHTDAFTTIPKDRYFRGGNRSWTFMIYLNDVTVGGETHFERLNLKIKPITGMAVVWYNILPNGKINHDTLHEGLPVLQGEKYIITKWFRENSIS
ncbi:MAG: oxygenase [Rhodospirillaceae bacterium]|nr:oxygenase [Rhodospirillaceae bacterium]OUX67975.1 MAG: hypothetical protein CBD38_00725 [bacterium TMED178]|tara:strand:- start:3471 stop:4214 length:744 start_codon:yes stop_codon:yes gene_type:complete